MRYGILAAAAAALVLGACSRASKSEEGGASDAIVVASAPAPAMARAEAVPADAPPPPPPGQGPGAQGGVMLAYSYAMGIKAPKDAIEPLVAAHTKICIDVGVAVCQVLGSSVNSYNDEQTSGYLSLRAEPKWLATYRAAIPSDAEKAGGKITQNTVSSEDLTTQITDTQARLQAKIALRDRIKALLERRDGTLSDALQAERELANVQGEIDSMTAQLESMKARVAMSALTISYETDLNKSGVAANPVVEALSDFGRVTLESLGGIIRFISRTWLPALFLLGLLLVLRLLVPVFWTRKKRA